MTSRRETVLNSTMRKNFLRDDTADTLSKRFERQRTARELRLLSYCLKSNLNNEPWTAAVNNVAPSSSNATEPVEKSECFAHLSECLMGGVIARKKITTGINAYKIQDYKAAYRDWLAASRLCENRELFYTLNYLISLSFDFGKFRKMLGYAVHQFQIARFLGERNLIAEAYLNLLTARGLLCDWEICLSYCKSCLAYLDVNKAGYVYMSVACAYLELNRFSEAAGFLKLTCDVCNKQKNYGLLVQALVACSGMFFSLKSYPEAKEFAMRALELAGTIFSINPGSARYRRCAVHLIPIQIKLRQLDEAMQLCEETVRSALEYHDVYVQAKCLLYFADISRLRSDHEIAYQSYQASLDCGYPQLRLRALFGIGKSVLKMRPLDGNQDIAQAKALNYYQEALELATSLGCKLDILRCYRRMAKLHLPATDDSVSPLQHVQELCDQLQLFCNLCGNLCGLKRSQLIVLGCGHIYHRKCLTENGKVNGKHYCVTCRSLSEDLCESFLVLL